MPIHVSLSPLEPKRKAVEAIATGLTVVNKEGEPSKP